MEKKKICNNKLKPIVVVKFYFYHYSCTTQTHALHGRESESDYVYYHLIKYIPGFVKVTTFHSDNQIRKCRNKKLRAGELVALHSLLDISK